jgi:hypothetical protein
MVRFAPFHQQTEDGRLFGGVRLIIAETEIENDVFLLRLGRRFSLKN